ncbi:f-box domain containing protein [Colletotrichum asianum]
MEQLDDNAQAEPLNTVDNQSSRLVRLPTELLLEIAKFFEWHDKFLFSHTCKRAKKVIGMDMKDWDNLFELKRPSRIMSKAARIFLAGLAWTMPHHWVCEFCVKLHHISQDCPASDRAGLSLGDVDGYTLCKHMMHTLGGLVCLSWERSPNSGSSPQGFDCNLITAFEERGTPVKGYCNYCLLDYTLVATADSFIVESWQSLGRYDRPQDALTDEPLDFKDLPLEDRHWMLFPGRIIIPRSGVALMGGELVYHQPGSVRDAYMSG